MTEREPRYQGRGFRWYYNENTRLGEIQLDAGFITQRSDVIAMSDEKAEQFDKADDAAKVEIIKSEYTLLQQKRAARRR